MLKMYRNVAVSAYCWLVLPRLELRQGNARVWFTCLFLKHLRGIDFCEDVRLVFSDGVEGARDTYYYSAPKDFERLLVNVFVRSLLFSQVLPRPNRALLLHCGDHFYDSLVQASSVVVKLFKSRSNPERIPAAKKR